MTVIRMSFVFLIVAFFAMAEKPLKIIGGSPLGLPCDPSIEATRQVGCMTEDQLGWLAFVEGEAAAYRGVLTYRKTDGSEATATVIVEASGMGVDALAFRVGRFWPEGNQFVSLEVTALKAVATVRHAPTEKK